MRVEKRKQYIWKVMPEYSSQQSESKKNEDARAEWLGRSVWSKAFSICLHYSPVKLFTNKYSTIKWIKYHRLCRLNWIPVAISLTHTHTLTHTIFSHFKSKSHRILLAETWSCNNIDRSMSIWTDASVAHFSLSQKLAICRTEGKDEKKSPNRNNNLLNLCRWSSLRNIYCHGRKRHTHL